MRLFVSKPKDKLNEIIENLNEVELTEVIDYVEFINSKRQKTFDEAFKNVPKKEEILTEEELAEIEESKKSGNISYTEMWDGFDEV